MTTYVMLKSLQVVVLLFINSATPEPKQFIIDTKSPIVIKYEETGRNEGISSYFGYSLANMKNFGSEGSSQPPQPQHQSDPRNGIGGSSSHTLFIGAPKDNRLPNSGAVWACTFKNTNQRRNHDLSCSLLTEVSSQSESIAGMPKECPNPDLSFAESQADQWIGASLSASTKNLYAFAPRWKKNGYYNEKCSNTAMPGAHYQITTGGNIAWRTPMDDKNRYTYSSATSKFAEYWLVYAEYGIASHVTSASTLIVGAPAARKWTGMYIEHTATTTSYWYNLLGETIGIDPHSYLGYALSSGKTQNLGYYIVAGAPRAKNLDGAVVITSPGATTPIAVLVGTQFGGYFGHSLATVDINGDNQDEILVGAPMYTGYNKSDTINRTGCVFGYSMSQIYGGNTEPSKILCLSDIPSEGEQLVTARFGAAIANIGDINFDKYEDFAVAAPYDDNGVGTVFIFYGSGSFSTMSDRPAQVIRGKLLSLPNLKGFGTILSSNKLDVDGNGTPDLAIGSFESEIVVVIRTRPVARARVEVSFLDTSSKPIDKFLPSHENLVVRMCVRFEFSIGLTTDSNLATWLKFDVDPSRKRFEFADNKPSEVQEDLPSLRRKCVDRRLKLKTGLSQEDTDSGAEIQFRGSVWYNYTAPLETQGIQHAAIKLSSLSSKKQHIGDSSYKEAFRSFNPYLPAPIPETSERKSLAIAEDNCKPLVGCDPDLQLDVEMFVDGSTTPYSSSDPLIIGQLNTLKLSIKVSNRWETAYSPVLRVSIEFSDDFDVPIDSLSINWEEYSKLDRCSPFNANDQNDTTSNDGKKKLMVQSLRCSKPLQTRREVDSSVLLSNLHRIRVNDSLTGSLRVSVEAYPEEQMETEMVKKRTDVPLEARIEIEIDQSYVSGLADVDPRTSDNANLIQVYKLRNTKVSAIAVGAVKAEILIPVQLPIEGKLEKVIGVVNPSNIDGFHCKSEHFDFFNPTELSRSENSTEVSSDSNTIGTRPTRSVKSGKVASSEPSSLSSADKQDTPSKKSSLPPTSRNNIKLSGCAKMPSVCQKIICSTDLESKGVKEIRLQMYLLDDIKKLISDETTGIQVESSISVEYPHKKVVHRVGFAQRNFTRVNAIPALYYILGVGGGFLLFALVSFCLYQAGFFRRKRKEELTQLKRKTQMFGDMSMLETVTDEDANDAYQ